MRHRDNFVLSHRPYAVRLDSLTTDPVANYGYCTVDAIWFRRRRGVTVACHGVLWDYLRPPAADAADFLTRTTDGRYGGKVTARWDGDNLWGGNDLSFNDMTDEYNLLRKALDLYPEVPAGYDGWWEYER